MFEGVRIALRDGFREIPCQLAGEIGLVRHRRFEQVVIERQLGIGEQHREFRPREWLRPAAALGELHVIGQKFDRAVEQATGLKRLDQPLQEPKVFEAAPFRERQRQGLQIVVAQHQSGDFIGHFVQQYVARVHGQPAVTHRNAQRDLDIHFHVGRVHAGRIIDRVGIEPHAAQRRFDAAALGHAQIGALADHLAAQILARQF